MNKTTQGRIRMNRIKKTQGRINRLIVTIASLEKEIATLKNTKLFNSLELERLNDENKKGEK